MKQYPVRFSLKSLNELENHWLYILEDSQHLETANAVLEQVQGFCYEKLAYFPEIGRRRDDVDQGVRFFPTGSYGVYYYFDGEEIYIAHVLHQSQDYKNIF